MSPRQLALAGALLIPFAVPAAAQAAPVIPPLKPCYVTAQTASGPQSEQFTFTATGFTPNSVVDVSIDDGLLGSLQADAAGNVLVENLPAPFIRSGFSDFTVTLTEQGNPANTASATAKTSALGVSVKPREARPSSTIRFKGLGFTQNKGVWAHYLYKGKLRKTVKMASDPGTCGSFTAHRRQIPVSNPGTGRWTIQFDQSKKYRSPANVRSVFVRLVIVVSLRPA